MIKGVLDKTSFVLKVVVVLYFFIAFFYFFNVPQGSGDEALFISDLQLIKDAGWYEAIVKNISIPYLILAYPFSFFLENHIALRVTNLFLLGLLFFYFYYFSNRKIDVKYYYLLFFISTVGYFYLGTNDCLFFVSLVIFLNEVNNATQKKQVNLNIALTSLIFAFFTRELIYVYLPIIILGLFILYHFGSRLDRKSILPFLFFVLLLSFNIPSIKNNGHLSYDRKLPPTEYSVSWAQRQYLAQLMVNNGELKNGTHPDWKTTQEYISINGKDALPEGIINGMLYDYKLTISEFFKDFAYSFVYSLRSLGLMLLIIWIYWYRQFKIVRKLDLNQFIPFSALIMMMVFSLIIISYVELRWLAPVFIMAIIYFSNLEIENKIANKFLILNNVTICLFSIYGIIRVFAKI